ncbi:hypothetical protein F4679DRAFT_588646 [Xylaria curta]|nr:hypothetical protein F4679DRAFT_588646 [Xylaria curta]
MAGDFPLPLNGEPLNREPPVSDLVSNFITGVDAYDRNHGPLLSPATSTA